MLDIDSEDNKLRKKRPERQLYVPPAQRRSSLNETTNSKVKSQIKIPISCKKETASKEITHEDNGLKSNTKCKLETSVNDTFQEAGSSDCIVPTFNFLLYRYFIKTRQKFQISNHLLTCFSNNEFNPYQRNYVLIGKILDQIPFIHFYSNNNSFLNEKLLKIYCKYCIQPLHFYTSKNNLYYKNFSQSQTVDKVPLIVTDFYESYSKFLKNFFIFCDFEMYSVEKTVFIDNSYKFYPCIDITLEGYLMEKQNTHIFDMFGSYSDTSSIVHLQNKDNASASEISMINQNKGHISINNFKSNKSDIKNGTNEECLRRKKLEKTDHEEEVEIMRKTKEHINRKTRPIMKYLGETNDTLKIYDDNIKSWEDLIDDTGELKEELLEVNKMDKSKKNNKLKKYSSDVTSDDIKHDEELEHMVELYDFPSSFKTQDLIQAFSNIDCDAMYIKWVDDTRAILVLGTLTQALKAVSLKNPLIKVRPMATASKVTLAIAQKNDLKPAMKRPQTNLQTARRFITAALGTKIGVSREKMAQERENLKAARDLKKLLKQNEKDAWEGNLQSSLH